VPSLQEFDDRCVPGDEIAVRDPPSAASITVNPSGERGVTTSETKVSHRSRVTSPAGVSSPK